MVYFLCSQENLKFEVFSNLKGFQKISVFPSSGKILKPSNLYNSLMKMKSSFPSQFNYFPEFFNLPLDSFSLFRFNEKYPKSYYKCVYVQNKKKTLISSDIPFVW